MTNGYMIEWYVCRLCVSLSEMEREQSAKMLASLGERYLRP